MHCIVTAGPSYEKLDKVRRLTNTSTGRLGIELANHLTHCGHDVTLLVGEQASYPGERRARRVESFAATSDLHDLLEALSDQPVHAVLHTAAVSDLMFGNVWLRSSQGELSEVNLNKLPSHHGTLVAELVPTPKIVAGLRDWFPKARIVGWKYEMDGKRAGVLQEAERQIVECLTDACVASGPAYGEGYGLVHSNGKTTHLAQASELFEALERCIRPGG
jgi:phosphopantothenoylcysteine synthetase/decarboxylase